MGTGHKEISGVIRSSICFLGVAGLHPDAGISMLVYEEAYVKRAMIEGGGLSIVLA